MNKKETSLSPHTKQMRAPPSGLWLLQSRLYRITEEAAAAVNACVCCRELATCVHMLKQV